MRVRNLVEGRWNFEQARRLQCPPWGLWGGKAGEAGGYLLRLPGENDFKPMVGAHIPVPLDAEAIVRTGGGGGWGDPLEREPDAGAHRRARGTGVAGGGACALRRGAAGRFDARRSRDTSARETG